MYERKGKPEEHDKASFFFKVDTKNQDDYYTSQIILAGGRGIWMNTKFGYYGLNV